MARYGSKSSRFNKKTKYSSNAKSNAYRIDKKFSKKMKKMENEVELKHVDHENSDVGDNVGQVEYVSPFIIGTTNSNLIGAEAQMTSIQCKGTVVLNSGYVPGSVVCRMIAFVDSAPNGILPSITATNGANAILDNSVVSDLTLAPYNHELVGKGKKFKILYDKHMTLTSQFPLTIDASAPVTTVTTVYAVQKYFSFTKKLSRKWSTTAALAPTGSFADAYRNGIYIAVMSDAAAEAPTFNYATRIYYKDA